MRQLLRFLPGLILIPAVFVIAQDGGARHYGQAAGHYAQGRYQEAAVEFGNVLSFAIDESSLLMRRNALFMQGMALFHARRYHEAQETFRRLRDRDPAGEAGIAAAFYFAESLRLAGRDENALFYLDAFYRNYPTHPLADDALFGIARIYYGRKLHERATVRFQELVNIFPDSNKRDAAEAMLLYLQVLKNPGARDTVRKDDGEAARLARLKGELDARQTRLDAFDRVLQAKEKNLDALKRGLDTREEALNRKERQIDAYERE